MQTKMGGVGAGKEREKRKEQPNTPLIQYHNNITWKKEAVLMILGSQFNEQASTSSLLLHFLETSHYWSP